MVYNRFTGTNVEMSIYSVSPRWATRRTIRTLLCYPFEVMGVRRVTAVTERPEVGRFLERLGFKHEGTLREGGRDGDLRVYGMTRREAERWLG